MAVTEPTGTQQGHLVVLGVGAVATAVCLELMRRRLRRLPAPART
jgi:hypothetical protein